jgi:hypothetical protein
MKHILYFLAAITLVTIPAIAQIYEGKASDYKAPLDQVIEEFNAEYANKVIAGAAEDLKPQALRYRQMTQALNEANERHFKPWTNELK